MLATLAPPRSWTGPVDATIAAVAAFGLPSTRSFAADPLDSESWVQAFTAIAAQRLDGLLMRAIKSGALPATDEQRGSASALHRRTMMRSLRLEGLLLDVVDSFKQHDIAYRVLKGSAIAQTAYPDPSLRSFCDVDVLVPASSFDAATATMAGHGAQRRYAEPRPGFDHRFSKGASFLTPDGLGIDLHRTFVLGPFGHTIDIDGLFRVSREFSMAGRTLVTMPLEETFVHVCLHTALGDWPPRLVPMRDVAQIAGIDALDLDRVHELARRWRATAPMAWSILRVWDTFGLPTHPLAEWARSYVPTRREQRGLALYMSSDRSYASMALASTRVVPGLFAKAAYLRALAVPSRTYVADRERTYRGRWHHATQLALRRTKSSSREQEAMS
ncbi:MAG: nucleotidyltransferase family protein [Acidimicrobiales bacterium]